MHFGNINIKIYQYHWYDAISDVVMSALFSICAKIDVLDGWVMLDGSCNLPWDFLWRRPMAGTDPD